MINWLRDRKQQQKLQKEHWLIMLSWSKMSHTDAHYYFHTCQPIIAWLDENEIDYAVLGEDFRDLWLSPEDAMAVKIVWAGIMR